MCSIRMDAVAASKACLRKGIVFRKGIDIYDPSHSIDPLLRNRKMIRQPAYWHYTVSIRVRQPAVLRRPTVACQRYPCRFRARLPDSAGTD
jgi:hypothetical protein